MIVNSADPVSNAGEAVNLAEHIPNAVDILMGVIKTRTMESKDMIDYTQWIVIKDLTNNVLYFRSYQDLALKRLHVKKLNFNPGAEMKAIRIESGMRTIIDMTEKLRSR
jgi:choloylglycine hydrolase